ncbi:MAG: hypothetical protein ACKOAL_08380 [Chthoniobacterales bacterium]
MKDSSATSYSQVKSRRALIIAGVLLVVLGVFGAAGYHLFTGWRARDLATKAKANFEQGNFRMAWLQVNSARDLRGGDPEVLRAAALIEAGFGRPEALDHLQQLAAQTQLTPEDLSARGSAALRHGNDEQFEQAVADLEKAGKVSQAGELRAARKLRRGDIDRAIAEARTAVAASADPALEFNLARLLVQRYRPEFRAGTTPSAAAVAGSAEAVGIVDALLGTPLRKEVLAFALNEMAGTPENRLKWADAAMDDVVTDNAALLPAAAVLVRSGQKTPQQIHEQLRPVFDAAPLERRAAYALWLTGAGMPKEALTMITAQEAGESTAAFGARTEALFATENLDAVFAAVESGGNVDDDVRFSVKARAEYARDHDAKGAEALGEAMVAAAKSGRLEMILSTGDALGAARAVDEKLHELCGDPSLSDYVFRVARDRFSRSGKPSALDSAFQRVQSVSPQSASVQDYARYRGLLEGKKADLTETAAACSAEPSNVIFRITHALNLLNHGKSAEALQAFDDITVFADQLPDGQLAVIAAVLHANGDDQRARAAVAAIDPNLLAPGEYALIAPIRTQSGGN